MIAALGIEFRWAPDYWRSLSWIEFLAYQRYAHKRGIERANAERRQEAGLDGRPAGPPSEEWAEYQKQLSGG